MQTVTATAHPNIAFIKYWGDLDPALHLPANGSISMNLAGLTTRTRVTFNDWQENDHLVMNGRETHGPALQRVVAMLERVRALAGIGAHALVESENNFPTGTGIASSASAFAALSLAASTAAGLHLDEPALSRLARTGSGSACRSIPGGFVEWQAGSKDDDSYAVSIASPEHWQLVDCITIVSQAHKHTGSAEGHTLAAGSPLFEARRAQTPALLDACRRAILERDFAALARASELDCSLMHAVMMTSTPALHYWLGVTVEIMHAVRGWRAAGIPVFYTIDAGPNVHVLCTPDAAPLVKERLEAIPGVLHVIQALPGGPARLEFC